MKLQPLLLALSLALTVCRAEATPPVLIVAIRFQLFLECAGLMLGCWLYQCLNIKFICKAP